MRSNRLASLPANIFSGPTDLLDLNLYGNQFTTLPATLFNGLTKLQTLDLHSNWLSILPTPTPSAAGTTNYTGLLNHLTALQNLYLYSNQLSTLPDGLLAGLTNLTTVNFTNNRISPLPLTLRIVPASSSNLLAGNSITAKIALPAGAPQALTIPLTITGGNLSSNSLTIAQGATESASFTITRTGNDTTVVSFGTLPTFLTYNPSGVSVSGLRLSGTSLTLFIESKPIFSAAPSNATHRPNSPIPPLQLPAATGGNGALTYSLTATASNGGTLDNTGMLPTGLVFDTATRVLSGTPTATGTYSMTYSVQDADSSMGTSDTDSRTFTLTVTATMTPLPTPVCDRTAAVRDAVVAAAVVSACADVNPTHLQAITSLNLASKSISSLKAGDLSGLDNLISLQLQNNSIQTLPTGLFAGLDGLVSLSLRDNLLTMLPANAFQDLSSLRILWLHNNRLDQVDSTAFAGLHSLQELYLNNNQLTTLPSTLFADLSVLTKLHLGQNRIATLPAPTGSADSHSGLLNGLDRLQELYLNSNRLTGLHINSFRNLRSLTHLSLRDNRLATLPTGVDTDTGSLLADLRQLKSLWLHGNRLSSLPEDLFDGPGQLTEALLHGNTTSTFALPVKMEVKLLDSSKPTAHIVLRLPLPAPKELILKLSKAPFDADSDSQHEIGQKGLIPFIFPSGSQIAGFIDRHLPFPQQGAHSVQHGDATARPRRQLHRLGTGRSPERETKHRQHLAANPELRHCHSATTDIRQPRDHPDFDAARSHRQHRHPHHQLHPVASNPGTDLQRQHPHPHRHPDRRRRQLRDDLHRQRRRLRRRLYTLQHLPDRQHSPLFRGQHHHPRPEHPKR